MEISINGRIVPRDRALVSAADMSLLHGSGLFTTVRVYGGRAFRLHDHLERLLRSAADLYLNCTVGFGELLEMVEDVLDVGQMREGRLRVTVTAGDSPLVFAPVGEEPPRSNVVITLTELQAYPAELYRSGVSVIVSDHRHNPSDALAGHKTTSYLGQLLGLQEARSRHALEALRFTHDGRLAEASVANVFIVQEDRLITPPLSLGILPGVARGVALEVARESGLQPEERDITLQEVLDADEVLLTNSIMEVLPVVRVERRAIGDEKVGEAARALLAAYQAQVCEELELVDRAGAGAGFSAGPADDDEDEEPDPMLHGRVWAADEEQDTDAEEEDDGDNRPSGGRF